MEEELKNEEQGNAQPKDEAAIENLKKGLKDLASKE